MKPELGLLIAAFGFTWMMGLLQGWQLCDEASHGGVQGEKANNSVGTMAILGGIVMVVGLTMWATLTFSV